VAAYPTPANWRDSLRIYRKLKSPDETATLDLLRLARATNALSGDGDFYNYAIIASNGSSPGEARAVIDEAVAAKQIDPSKPMFKDIIANLKTKRALGRELLPQLAKEAKAGSTARLALRTGDAYYGYGDYTQAAELYRAALTKSGADANLINLHLGMALARSGDKAGATAALNAVTGPQADLAKYWLVYVGTGA
jgi:tetratricopeptide (TPR) repeat protein